MKLYQKIICGLLILAIAAGSGVGIYYMQRWNHVEEVVNRVTVPPQTTAETPERFVPEEMQEFVPPEGENLAKGAKLTESGHTDVYFGNKAIDGRDTTYWEGNGFPATLTIDFGAEQTFTKIALRLPPLRAWSARTQTVTIEISLDGENFSPLLSEQSLSFDPMTGNAVLLTVDAAKAAVVRITFLANSGAGGGQVSEIMFFA
jgi:hypothetical protein